MEALGRAIFIALNCLENCFSIARFYAGDDLGEILISATAGYTLPAFFLV
jgi:hypothetical protein